MSRLRDVMISLDRDNIRIESYGSLQFRMMFRDGGYGIHRFVDNLEDVPEKAKDMIAERNATEQGDVCW